MPSSPSRSFLLGLAVLLGFVVLLATFTKSMVSIGLVLAIRRTLLRDLLGLSALSGPTVESVDEGFVGLRTMLIRAVARRALLSAFPAHESLAEPVGRS